MPRKGRTGHWKRVKPPLIIALATPCPICKQSQVRYVIDSNGEVFECTSCGWSGDNPPEATDGS